MTFTAFEVIEVDGSIGYIACDPHDWNEEFGYGPGIPVAVAADGRMARAISAELRTVTDYLGGGPGVPIAAEPWQVIGWYRGGGRDDG